MKIIKILELRASNFRAQNFKDTYQDTNFLSGKNGSGKSTRIAAWLWLIIGKTDASSPANFRLFNDKEELSPNTPTAIVEALVSVDGEQFKIRREATASFQRKQGSGDYIKSASDSYRFFVDDVEYTSTEFKDFISVNFCNYDMIQYSLDGSFFVDLVFSDKKRARSIIEKTVGTVERSEMKGDYSDIDELLQKMSPSQIEEQSKNLSKSIDARLNEIQTIISQKEDEISEIKQTDFTAVQNEIDTLEGEQKSIEEKIFNYSARTKPLLEEQAKAEHDKRMKQEVYDKAKTTYTQNLINEDNNLCAEISRMEKSNADKKARISELQRMNATDEKQKADYVQSINELRDKAKEIESRKFSSTGVCPTCGQPMPQGWLECEEVNFKEAQKKEYDGVVARGKEVRGWIENIDNTIAKRNEEIRTLETSFEDAEPLKQKLSTLRTSDIAPFELTEQGKALQADIDAVVIPEVKMPEDGELKQQAADIKGKLKGLYMKKGLQSRLSSLETDIETLRTEQREKGAELAMYERRRQLVKDFKQEQMGILSLKVNEKLKFSRLDIWSTQKDGSIIPDVIIKNKEGVSFATANNASRLVTITDIQRFFCECLGVNMPIFLDEASTIDEKNIPHYNNTQIFLLFRADTSLKIESK